MKQDIFLGLSAGRSTDSAVSTLSGRACMALMSMLNTLWLPPAAPRQVSPLAEKAVMILLLTTRLKCSLRQSSKAPSEQPLINFYPATPMSPKRAATKTKQKKIRSFTHSEKLWWPFFKILELQQEEQHRGLWLDPPSASVICTTAAASSTQWTSYTQFLQILPHRTVYKESTLRTGFSTSLMLLFQTEESVARSRIEGGGSCYCLRPSSSNTENSDGNPFTGLHLCRQQI